MIIDILNFGPNDDEDKEAEERGNPGDRGIADDHRSPAPGNPDDR